MIQIDQPKMITRETYQELIRAAGFDPDELLSMRFTAEGIYAEVFARDEQGRKQVDGDEIAAHTVFVGILKDEGHFETGGAVHVVKVGER